MLATMQMSSPHLSLPLSQAWPAFTAQHNVVLPDIKRFLIDVASSLPPFSPSESTLTDALRIQAETLPSHSSQTSNTMSGATTPLSARPVAIILAFLSRGLAEASEEYRRKLEQPQIQSADSLSTVSESEHEVTTPFVLPKVETPPTPPTSEDEDDSTTVVDHFEDRDSTPTPTGPVASGSHEHFQKERSSSPWSFDDYFEYRSSDRTWNCLHPSCQRYNNLNKPGTRKFGSYSAPRYGVSGIKKRAEEHSRKHNWSNVKSLARANRTRWWRNGEQVKPTLSERNAEETSASEAMEAAAVLSSIGASDEQHLKYQLSYLTSSIRDTQDAPISIKEEEQDVSMNL